MLKLHVLPIVCAGSVTETMTDVFFLTKRTCYLHFFVLKARIRVTGKRLQSRLGVSDTVSLVSKLLCVSSITEAITDAFFIGKRTRYLHFFVIKARIRVTGKRLQACKNYRKCNLGVFDTFSPVSK